MTCLEGIYRGKKVLIRVQDIKSFIEEPDDKIGFVHCIDSKGCELIEARRGEIHNIRVLEGGRK